MVTRNRWSIQRISIALRRSDGVTPVHAGWYRSPNSRRRCSSRCSGWWNSEKSDSLSFTQLRRAKLRESVESDRLNRSKAAVSACDRQSADWKFRQFDATYSISPSGGVPSPEEQTIETFAILCTIKLHKRTDNCSVLVHTNRRSKCTGFRLCL